MTSIGNVIFYILIFFTVYIQVFFFITFLENRKKLVVRNGKIKLKSYPAVRIVVPCWDEEKTVYKTVRSLLGLNYPKDKLKIFLIDDGSTDDTLHIIRRFEKYPNIKVFHKKNGGKYTALNLGLEHVETAFFGCLDADSLAHPESLVRIMSYFEKDEGVMAVAPSILVHDPKNIVQRAQKVEGDMSVFLKKMLGFLGAIHVTPGPLTIFRKKVFSDLGPYRHAHNTEDMEIAFRMQKNHYKIDQCNDAYVYTNVPKTVRKLFRQRLRWIYGFINNTIDYRDVIFRRKYGNFSTFTLPVGLLCIFAVSFTFGKIIYNFANFISFKIMELKTVGFSLAAKMSDFDAFFINTQSIMIFIIFLYFFVTLSVVLGRKMAEGRWRVSLNILSFFFIFSFVGPLWLMKAVYNTIISRRMPSWR